MWGSWKIYKVDNVMSKEVQPLHKILEIFNQWNI